jgi:polynucleotide 5'-kinase involved in rRNA processing
MLDDYSSTSLSYNRNEAIETITLGSCLPVIAIYGAKNVEKSTFAWYLANSLPNRSRIIPRLCSSQ